MSSTIPNQSTPIQSDSFKLPAVKKFQLKYESIDSLQKAAGAKSIEEYEEALNLKQNENYEYIGKTVKRVFHRFNPFQDTFQLDGKFIPFY